MSIIVKTQAELDKIPLDTNEQIYIEFGTCNNPAIVKNKYLHRVIANSSSSVVAWNNSSITARGNSSVVALGNSSVLAYNNSCVKAYGNVQVVDELLSAGSIQLSGNARKVCMPKK